MAELYDASDEVLEYTQSEIPGGVVLVDTETGHSAVEVARNYWGDEYDKHYDPVYLRASDASGNYVLVALNVESAAKLRDALNGIVTLYS